MLCFRRKGNEVYTTVIWMLMTVTTYTKQVNIGEGIVANVIQDYAKPLNNLTALRAWMSQKGDKISVEAFIKQKVKELKPFLEDNTVEVVDDDKITLEGDDETTIIEFNPIVRSSNHDEETKAVEHKAKDFQENLQKYKKLRSKIRKALKREKVTNKTKSLVTKTLDKMIAQMIAHRCSWPNSAQNKGMMNNETDKNELDNVIRSWNNQWSKLKHQFKSKKGSGETEDAEIDKDKFLKKFQDLVSVMSYDLNTVAGKYKVVCRYEDINKKDKSKTVDKNIIRTDGKKKKHLPGSNIKDKNYLKTVAENAVINNNHDDTVPCTHFKICSEELTQFLLNFYITFNDTAVSVISNYAAMFLRDVSDDSYHEKERVVKLIMNIAKTTEKKAELLYKKQTKKLKLSKEKNRFENLKILYEYVAKTIERFKKLIHKEVETSLTSVREKLMHIIQKDIDVNMALDLDNLERDINTGICHIFEVCNGVVYSSRKTSYVGDKNNVYVKVQLKLTDDEKTDNVRFKIKETKYPLRFGVTRTVPNINNLVLNIEPSFNQNDDIILRAKTIIVNDTNNDGNINRTISSVDQFVLGINPGGNHKRIKDGNPDDVKVKITFLEETKEEEGKVASKKKRKRSKFTGFRREEHMRQLALNGINNQTVTINNITKDIKLNII